jgi:hypothetical protein
MVPGLSSNIVPKNVGRDHPVSDLEKYNDVLASHLTRALARSGATPVTAV